MPHLSGEQTCALLDGIVHADTQQRDSGVDLTVAAIYKMTTPGRIDFGGSEFEEAERAEVRAEKQHRDDTYGWWELPAGTYVVEYNEQVGNGEETLGLVTPAKRLLQAGAHHPCFRVKDSDGALETILSVGDNGIHIKENARISTLIAFEK